MTGAAVLALDLPWSDCKVAFGCDDSDVWDHLCEDRSGLPAGWLLDEWDAAGARGVIVFRVEGPLNVADGKTVAALLATIEAAINAAPSSSSQSRP